MTMGWINSAALYSAAGVFGIVSVFLLTGMVIANQPADLVVGSGVLVTAGVFFTGAVKLHSEERDRAFRFLTENQNSRDLLDAMVLAGHLRTLNGIFTQEQAAELYLSRAPDSRGVIKKLATVANFFEEMAIGIRSLQINEYIVKEFYLGMLYRFGIFMEPFMPIIRNTPVIDGHPFGNVSRPEVYENMQWLFQRWRSEYEKKYVRSGTGTDSSLWTGRPS
jgi:hypothetical protein